MEVQNNLKVSKYCDNRYQNRVLGSLIGGLLGDALGRPVEHIDSLNAIKNEYPPSGIVDVSSLKSFKDYAKDKDDNEVVPYTDDTGMTLLVLKALIHTRLNDSDLNTTMNELAQLFVVDMNKNHGWREGRKCGVACLDRVKKLQTKINDNQTDDAQWWAVGEGSKNEKERGGGCGSLMRVHPCGLVFAHDLHKVEEFAVAQSTLTHSHPFALAACAAQAVGIALALRGEEPDKIVENMIEIAKKYSPDTANRMNEARQEALQKKFNSVNEAIEGSQNFYKTYQGFVACDAIAAVVYAFTLYKDDLKSAIQLSVNTPGDSDSIASMTGALVGARTGWQEQLLKKNLQIQFANNYLEEFFGLEGFFGLAWLKNYRVPLFVINHLRDYFVSNQQVVKLEGIEYIKKLAKKLYDIQITKKENFKKLTLNNQKFEFVEPEPSKKNFWLNKRVFVTVACYVLCFCFLLKQLNSGLKEIIERTV